MVCACILMLRYDLHRFNSLILLSYISPIPPPSSPSHPLWTKSFDCTSLSIPLVCNLFASVYLNCMLQLFAGSTYEQHDQFICFYLDSASCRTHTYIHTHKQTHILNTLDTSYKSIYSYSNLFGFRPGRTNENFYGKLSLGYTV